MLHLPTDRLAALADEAPSPDEAAHLALCAECAREVRAHEALLSMATAEKSTGGYLAMPLTRWESLGAELRREGLIGAAPRTSAPVRATRRIPAWIGRAAAAVLLLAGGAVAGRYTAPVREVEVAAKSDRPPAPKPGTKPPVSTPPERGGISETPDVSLASFLPSSFESVTAARLWQQKLEVAYQDAAAYIAANDTSDLPTVERMDDRSVRARLAALDAAGSVMREALREAPADPVINGYYLTTLGQREATLRQINAVSPAGARVIGF